MFRNVKRPLCRAASVISAVFAALMLLPSLALCTLSVAFPSAEALSESLVTPGYLQRAKESASSALLDESLVWGVDAEVLLGVLEKQSGEIKENAQNSLKSLIDALLVGTQYEIASFDASGFESAIAQYVQELLSSDPDLEIPEGAVKEIALECATVVSSAAAPISPGLVSAILPSVSGVLPDNLPVFLKTAALLACALWVAFLAGAFFAAEKNRRFFTLFSSLFCGAVLSFVPAFFLFSSADFSALALSESVLLEIVKALASRVVVPFRVSSAVIFAVSVLGLLGSIWLLCRPGTEVSHAPQEESQTSEGE